MKDKLLKIDIRLKNDTYKVASFFSGSDGSLYIAHPKTIFAKEIEDSRVNAIKFSYHPRKDKYPRGFSQFTIGSQGNRMKMTENFKELRNSFEDIKGIEPLICLSFFDLATINSRCTILDSSSGKRAYKNYRVIDGNSYSNLTLNMFLSEKNCLDIANPTHKHREMFVFELDKVNLIITLRDYWMGKKQII